MSREVRQFPVWPVGTPLPTAAMLWFYDPATDEEYRFVPGQLGAQAGGIGVSAVLADVKGPSGMAAAKQAGFGTLYAIRGKWNDNLAPVRTVLIVGLSDGSFASSGLLLLPGGGSQAVTVDAEAGTYAAITGGGVTQAQLDAVATTLPLTGPRAADYTLAAADSGSVVLLDNAADAVVTVPAAVFAAGAVAYVRRRAAGAVALVAGPGLSLRTPAGAGLQVAELDEVSLHFEDANVCYVKGGTT